MDRERDRSRSSQQSAAAQPQRVPRPVMLRGEMLAMVAGLLFVAGCWPTAPANLYDSDAPQRIVAIEQTVRDSKKDPETLRLLVRNLGSDDQAVRFYAIYALRQLTGQSLGYLYYADDDQRLEAIRRWETWLAEQMRPPATQPAQEASSQSGG